MQTNVLLSIKPEFAEKIFQGVKKYEFRKALFKNRNVKKVVVYASAPISKVIGEFEIEDILEHDTESLWAKTKKHSGIPKEYFDSYFQGKKIGYAIKISKSKLYKDPLDLNKHFKLKCPPQSFMYISV
jgi:predicted transcriptional regulator